MLVVFQLLVMMHMMRSYLFHLVMFNLCHYSDRNDVCLVLDFPKLLS